MLELRIRQSRLQKGWNQSELARQMHVAQPTISAWETGLKAPRLKILLRLSQVLGVNFEWLSTGSGLQYPAPAGALDRSAAGEQESASAATYILAAEIEEEERLLSHYFRLSPNQRQALLALLDAFHSEDSGSTKAYSGSRAEQAPLSTGEDER